MRRSLLITAAAAISMVLLAMLVPMAVLVRSYALEDRLARAALEVQAVETVVSGGDDKGAVSVYLDRINGDWWTAHAHHGALPRRRSGSGPTPARTPGCSTRATPGRARVDDVAGGVADPGAGLAAAATPRSRRRLP